VANFTHHNIPCLSKWDTLAYSALQQRRCIISPHDVADVLVQQGCAMARKVRHQALVNVNDASGKIASPP
jgi:hypothetical protein